jgi:RNA polymerase sigma factor (sigma-70 family)
MLLGAVRTDEDLIRDCLNGDEAAWAELIRTYQRLIYSVARVLCPEPADAADVFQQVCLELYQGLPYIRDIQSLPKWVVTVTRRRSIDMLRRTLKTLDFDENQLVCDSEIETLQRQRDLERAIEQLPDRCRRLLVQLYFSETPSTYEDVQRHLGIPVSSIGPTRARCLQKLRALLESA